MDKGGRLAKYKGTYGEVLGGDRERGRALFGKSQISAIGTATNSHF